MTGVSSAPEARRRSYAGHTVGGFRLVREIACGGMASVYLGHKVEPTGVQQIAAVKIVHPNLAREMDFIDMFLDEARIVSSIDHPNVCKVLDVGKSDSTYYLAMEYVMGETWGDVLARLSASPDAQTMFVPTVAHIFSRVCEGLHAAHEAKDSYGNPLKIVHRDVSPQNIMIGYDGSVRVLDFGVASAAEKIHTTRTGELKGRLPYMAPEQMHSVPVDRRADVWSLGVVLWEALARKRLFRRSDPAKTMLAVTVDPLPSLSDCGYPVPTSLQGIVTQALQRDCSERYASARELGLALAEALEPFGVPDVSKWMHRLFEQEIDQKHALLREIAAGRGEIAPSNASSSSMAHAPGEEDRRASPVKRATHSTSPIALPISLQEKSPRSSTFLAAAAGLLVAASLTVLGTPRASEVSARAQPVRTEMDAQPLALGVMNTKPAAASGRRIETMDSPATQASPGEGEAKAAAPAGIAAEQADLTFALEDVERFEQQAPAPPERARQAGQTGMVSIATSGPQADVYLNSRKLGTTPLRLTLPVGTHALRFHRLGTAQDIVRRVTVEKGGTTRLTLPMK